MAFAKRTQRNGYRDEKGKFVTRNYGGFELNLYKPQEKLNKLSKLAMFRASQAYKEILQKNLSEAPTGGTRTGKQRYYPSRAGKASGARYFASKPGEYPQFVTGRLHDSINIRPSTPGAIRSRNGANTPVGIGSDAPYATALESDPRLVGNVRRQPFAMAFVEARDIMQAVMERTIAEGLPGKNAIKGQIQNLSSITDNDISIEDF